MIIHKSHSKKEIIKIFRSIEVCIDPSCTKREICENFNHYESYAKYNDDIQNLSELIQILKSQSNKRRISVETKKEIMLNCKKVINFCNNHHIYNASTFNNPLDLYNAVLFIHPYGDIPSVRRACQLYNNSPMQINHINPIISKETIELLEERKEMKKIRHLPFSHKKGNFIVLFD